MNEKNIVDPIENKKEKLYVNELYNEIIDVVEFVENKHENFQEFFKTFNKSNSFIINRYYENDVEKLINEKYDVEIIKNYSSYILNNKTFYDVEFEIVDPLFKTISINKDQLKNIFHDEINNVEKLFICNLKNINYLIELNIDLIYQIDNKNYLNHYSIENKINSYDLLKLFEFIVDDVVEFNENMKNDDEFNYDDEKIDVDELLKLFEYVIDKLNYLSNLNKYYHYFNSNRKFKINLNNSLKYLCNNNKFDIYYHDDIIYSMLNNDLYELFVDPEILYDMNFKFEIDYDINDLLFQEYLYINNLIDDEKFEFNYVVEIDENNNYENYYIEISIDDILKLNKGIKNINELLFDPFKIDEIFENYNNNYDDDEFIYLIFENEFEYLYNDEIFHHKYYYELNDIKFYSIDELKKYVLNYMQHLNLNCTFKFDDEFVENLN